MSFSAESLQNGQMLLFDKPVGWTSFDVVNFTRSFLRKVFNIKKLKVGHAGTLDPLATGLLIICTGRKTKEIDSYQGMDKVYIGSMLLGATTPSFDAETEPDQNFDISNLTNEDLLKAKENFVGEIEQVPPIYSAVKIDGKRAFKYARKNNEVKMRSRKVQINSFDIVNIDLPQVDFAVSCSKGTYIRSLANDFGKSLDNGAYLSMLRRTQIGKYNVVDAFTLESFKKLILEQAGE